jgi:CheY-like chemotaxis protein
VVTIRVKDTGIGIAPDLLAHVFDLFVQADCSLARSQGGLGIGLTLVRKLVEMHGGSVTASSPGPGQGSEFVVRLPVIPDRDTGAEEQPSTGKGRPARVSRRVLVVDDNSDAAQSAALLLRLWGHAVQTVHDGPSVLGAMQTFRPDIVLLDIGLPGMDGYDVARQLRGSSEFQDVVLAAMTGYGREQDQTRSREAGFDFHLTKPLNPDTLEAFIASPRQFLLRKDEG